MQNKSTAVSIGVRYRIALSWIFALIVGFMIFFSESRWGNNSLVGGLLFSTGCALAGAGALGRMWCSLYISGYKNAVLVTGGPYSMSRNPLYFFSLLGAVGVGFATKTFSVPFIILGFFAFYYPFVIRSEERRLQEIHKEKFEDYRRTTPSFFPRFSLLREPDEYVVNPKIFRANIFYAFWFIWLVGFLELVDSLHKFGLIPVFLNIY